MPPDPLGATAFGGRLSESSSNPGSAPGIEFVSLIWSLQIWVAIYLYGTMISWSTLIKKLMQTYIFVVCGSILNVSTVHLNGIKWHLIWRYPLKPVLGGHPVLRGHYSIPEGVRLIQVSLYQNTPNLFSYLNLAVHLLFQACPVDGANPVFHVPIVSRPVMLLTDLHQLPSPECEKKKKTCLNQGRK